MSREEPLARIEELESALWECVEAFRLTREYVGEENLPNIPGWSHFDATEHAKAVLLKPFEDAAPVSSSGCRCAGGDACNGERCAPEPPAVGEHPEPSEPKT